MDSHNHADSLKNIALMCNNFWVLIFQIVLKVVLASLPPTEFHIKSRWFRYLGFSKDQLD